MDEPSRPGIHKYTLSQTHRRFTLVVADVKENQYSTFKHGEMIQPHAMIQTRRNDSNMLRWDQLWKSLWLQNSVNNFAKNLKL
jgi:hypothetical protein